MEQPKNTGPELGAQPGMLQMTITITRKDTGVKEDYLLTFDAENTKKILDQVQGAQ